MENKKLIRIFKRILNDHNLKFQVMDESTIHVFDRMFGDEYSILTIENGKLHVDGKQMTIWDYLGY